jgi:hypothetical protein
MSEENVTPNPDENKGLSEGKPETPTASPGEKGEESPEVIALRARIKEEADKRREYEAQLAKLQEEQEKIRQAELEKQGEYKTLLEEERKAKEELAKKAEAWDNYQKARREHIYEKLTDDQKKVADNIPTLEGLELYFGQVSSTKTVPTAGDEPGGRKGEFGGYASKAEFAQADPEGYEKWRKDSQVLRFKSGTVRLPGQEPVVR